MELWITFSSFLILFWFVFLVVNTFRRSNPKRPLKNLPPGPRKLPLIGNLLQFVGFLPHHCLRNLANKYGPLMHLQLEELSTVVVSSPEMAKEIMKTHDVIFSNRPFIPSIAVLSYNGKNIGYSPYGGSPNMMILYFQHDGDMYVGGTETAATTVEWTMSEMMKNPKVMQEAQAEVRKVCGGKGDVEEADTHQLIYLKSVIQESLRLHPALPLSLPRESSEACEINGYQIPAKTKVIINSWAIGRDPRHWTDPEKFKPERFLDSPIDFKGTDCKYIPFGAGRRICPGITFAIPNVELSLAKLLYHFDWKLPNGMKPEQFDMTESFGATVRRKAELCLIPFRYHHT